MGGTLTFLQLNSYHALFRVSPQILELSQTLHQHAGMLLFRLPSLNVSRPHATIQNNLVCPSFLLIAIPTHTSTEVAVVNMQLCAGVPIEDSRKWTLFIVSIVFGPLSLATIALRTYSRYKITKKMDRDDWTIIAAGAVMVGVLVANYLSA